MKYFQQCTLSLFVIAVSIANFLTPAFAQFSNQNQVMIQREQDLIKNFIRFAQLEQRQNQLRKACKEGSRVACVEVQKVDRQIEKLSN